ncbi:beta-1,3-galactosyltransferase 1-like isoform X2 [Patella vulgata]|uniref:beta-1,3-galactosyltransferase 1-like isoform X2 n=1 Tax=Patella vulgata TaxID=6465 RepID=UPI00218005FE|nr:beta-1,3-galactosyltransferase 1-like isoform X2 [Patella vulgata]
MVIMKMRQLLNRTKCFVLISVTSVFSLLLLFLHGNRYQQMHRTYDTRPTVQQFHQIPTVMYTTTVYEYPDNYTQYFKADLNREVTPLNFKTLIDRPGFCDKNSTFLMVIILTMHSHLELRNSIRTTWGAAARTGRWAGKSLSQSVQYLFLLGINNYSQWNKKVEAEANIHEDILMFDYTESYNNLTYKVLTGLQWLQKNCVDIKYVMKIDEDTFIHLPRLLEKLSSPDWNQSICGFYTESEAVMKTSKNANDFSVYPFNHYPPHVKGNIYFMPFSIASRLVNVSRHFVFNVIEDVHITGILARVIGFRNKYKGFTRAEYSRSIPASACDIATGIRVASTHTSPAYYSEIWNKINDPETCLSIRQQIQKYFAGNAG